MPDPASLNKGVITGAPIGATGGTYDLIGQAVGTTANPDPRIWVGGETDLLVEVNMTGAAVGDLTVAVQPYASDGVTVMPQGLPPAQAPATNPAFAAGAVTFWGVYDVSGYEQVRVRLTNANAGAQTITRASWRLGAGG